MILEWYCFWQELKMAGVRKSIIGLAILRSRNTLSAVLEIARANRIQLQGDEAGIPK
jgi:hypothetical protein